MLVALLGQDDAELAPPGEVAPVARALGEGRLAGRPGERDDVRRFQGGPRRAGGEARRRVK